MTTDVINGVPRSLLEQVAIELEHDTDRYMLGRELRKLLSEQPQADHSAQDLNMVGQPQAGAGQDVPVAECTNEDSWNCKYCRKTEVCAALKDERNFGSPQKADRQEPVHITHRPLIRNAISLLSMRRPMAPDVERVVTDLSAMLDGLPTPAGAPSTAWLQVAEMAEAPSARHDQGDEVRRLREVMEHCKDELRWMIDKHNAQSQEDGSWLYDYQTVAEADAALSAHKTGEEE